MADDDAEWINIMLSKQLELLEWQQREKMKAMGDVSPNTASQSWISDLQSAWEEELTHMPSYKKDKLKPVSNQSAKEKQGNFFDEALIAHDNQQQQQRSNFLTVPGTTNAAPTSPLSQPTRKRSRSFNLLDFLTSKLNKSPVTKYFDDPVSPRKGDNVCSYF